MLIALIIVLLLLLLLFSGLAVFVAKIFLIGLLIALILALAGGFRAGRRWHL